LSYKKKKWRKMRQQISQYFKKIKKFNQELSLLTALWSFAGDDFGVHEHKLGD
jgi:hypothetical protein